MKRTRKPKVFIPSRKLTERGRKILEEGGWRLVEWDNDQIVAKILREEVANETCTKEI